MRERELQGGLINGAPTEHCLVILAVSDVTGSGSSRGVSPVILDLTHTEAHLDHPVHIEMEECL